MAEQLVEVHTDELSTEAHYALWYSLAVLVGGRAADLFKAADARLTLSSADKKRALQKGLNELYEKGLISLAKNGLGEFEPAQIRARFEPETGLILRDNT